MTADQQLSGGAVLQFPRLGGSCPCSRGSVHLGRLPTAPRVRQDVASLGQELATHGGIHRLQLQGEAIHLGRPIEGEGLSGCVGRHA